MLANRPGHDAYDEYHWSQSRSKGCDLTSCMYRLDEEEKRRKEFEHRIGLSLNEACFQLWSCKQVAKPYTKCASCAETAQSHTNTCCQEGAMLSISKDLKTSQYGVGIKSSKSYNNQVCRACWQARGRGLERGNFAAQIPVDKMQGQPGRGRSGVIKSSHSVHLQVSKTGSQATKPRGCLFQALLFNFDAVLRSKIYLYDFVTYAVEGSPPNRHEEHVCALLVIVSIHWFCEVQVCVQTKLKA